MTNRPLFTMATTPFPESKHPILELKKTSANYKYDCACLSLGYFIEDLCF